MISEFLINKFKTIPNVFISRIEKIPSIFRLPFWLLMVSVESVLATLLVSWWAIIIGLVVLAVLAYGAFFSEYPFTTSIVTLVGLSGATITLKDLILAASSKHG